MKLLTQAPLAIVAGMMVSVIQAAPEVPAIDRDVHMLEFVPRATSFNSGNVQTGVDDCDASSGGNADDPNECVRSVYTRPYFPTLQTTADGRLAISHKPTPGGLITFRLIAPEKLDQPFMVQDHDHLATHADGSPVSGDEILSRPNEMIQDAYNGAISASVRNNDVGGESRFHQGLCDPTFDPHFLDDLAGSARPTPLIERPNPYACDNSSNPSANGQNDCYDVFVVRGGREAANRDLIRIYSTEVTVRVENPKTADARIVAADAGDIVQGGTTFDYNGFLEPNIVQDGRLMFLRVGASNRTAFTPATTSPNGNNELYSDALYFVNDTPDAFAACDVAQWDTALPLSHAPYDSTINRRYGFAMQKFRDATGRVLGEFEPLGTYPWIDKAATMVSLTYIGQDLYDSGYATDCLDGVSDCRSDEDSQDGGSLQGRMIMGSWTRGKMVLLDNLLNNIDFTLRADDQSHRDVTLYETAAGTGVQKRVGTGRENDEYLLPLGNAGNTTFFDSPEHRFNYDPNMTPITPADVVWLTSSGRGTDEIAFDDFNNPNSFIVANMAQASSLITRQRASDQRITSTRNDIFESIQNAATAGRELFYNSGESSQANQAAAESAAPRDHVLPFDTGEWDIPALGELLGDARTESIANGGVKGKGLWLNGSDAGLRFDIPAQSRTDDSQLDNTDWYYGLFIDPRMDLNATNNDDDVTLISFPDGSEVRVRNANRLVYFDTEGAEVRTINTRIDIRDNSDANHSGWTHIGIQVQNNTGNQRITSYIDGNAVQTFSYNVDHADGSPRRMLMPEAGQLTIGLSGDTANASHFKGWIDDFKVFAERSNLESACNRAYGTLIGVPDSVTGRWRDLADEFAASTHNAITSVLNTQNRSDDVFPRYVCFADNSADYAAHLQNIPAGTYSIREAINFPEGGLKHDVPRPESTQNTFCTTCHAPGAVHGLSLHALMEDSGVIAAHDARRQPMQPDPLIFGNIPNNWLGLGNAAMNAGDGGIYIDTLILDSENGDADSGGSDPVDSGTTDLFTTDSLADDSGNWIEHPSVAFDDDTSDELTNQTRGAANSVWLTFDIDTAITGFTLLLQEDNQTGTQINRWKLDARDAATGNWVSVQSFTTSNTATLQSINMTLAQAADQLRVTFQAPNSNSQVVGLQHLQAIAN